MRKSKSVLVFLALLLAGFWGYMLIDDLLLRTEVENSYYIAFYPEGAETVSYTNEIEDYSHYRSQYDYNDRVYYNTLSEEAKQIYHFYEYALDHSYSNILIDLRLLPEEITPEDILYYLSLDSAMVEQNIHRGEQLYNTTLSFKGYVLRTEKTVDFHHIRITNFTDEHLRKKLQAIQKAEDVAATVPTDVSDTEKAQYLFDWLGQNVTYNDAENKNRDYLYEAFCEGSTNCDGFANAYAILCNLTDLPCFEKMYLPGEDEPERTSGHTWNSVQLDGVWYNVDPTASPNTQKDSWTADIRFWFGYSDPRQKDTPLYADVLPVCERNLREIAFSFSSPSDAEAVQKIGETLTERPKGELLFVSFETCDDTTLTKAVKKICNTYHITTSRVSYNTGNAGTIMVIIRK